MFPENCFCTLKEIKVGSHEFSRNQKIGHRTEKLLSVWFEILGLETLCPLTCAEWINLSNHARMSTIQSRSPERKARNHVKLTWKLQWKSCSTTHLPFLSSNPDILKTFPTKMKPTKCPAKEKKMRQEIRNKRGEVKS